MSLIVVEKYTERKEKKDMKPYFETSDWQIDIYNKINAFIRETSSELAPEDMQDMSHDVFLAMCRYYNRNEDKYWFKYHVHEEIERSCNRWLKNRSKCIQKEVSLYDENLHLEYIMDDSQTRYKEYCRQLTEYIEPICDVDRKILKLRFMDELTLEQIGKQVSLSPERVRQRIVRILRRYRRATYTLNSTVHDWF